MSSFPRTPPPGKSLVFQAAALKLLDEHADAVVLVLYPLKALVSDQLVSWRKILTQAGYPEDTIGKVDGDVLPDEREKLIRNAQIIVATPDVIHAWLMSNLAKPHHKRFLSRLKLIVIDEAHVFDSVFGSNFAYLFRRLAVAARMTDRSEEPEPLRVVASSATISNPAEHLNALTGLQFESINEASNGSPQHSRNVFHLAAPPGGEASFAAELPECSSAEIPGASLLLSRDKGRSALQSRLTQVLLYARIAVVTRAQIAAPLRHRCGTARFAEWFQLRHWSLESTFHISVWD